MRLGKYLTSRTKSELEVLREQLNLSDDELLIFNELSKGRSIIYVADKCGIGESTVSYKIKAIVRKLNRL